MPAIPWRLIGVLVAVGLLAWGAMWTVGRIRVSYQAEQERDTAIANHAAYVTEAERKATAATAQQAKDQAADAKTAAKLELLATEVDRLRRAIAGIKPTVEKTDENGRTRVAVRDDWWLCVTTFVTRDAADTATCEARAGASGVPDPVRH